MRGDDLPGTLIGGRFLLGDLLGVGGTASVFAAVDEQDEGTRAVALKMLHPHLCADASSREAFLTEAEHAARLQHPNIVRVHGAGLHDAGGVVMPWIAWDLLTGPTLRDYVRAHGPLGVHDAIAVIDGVLAGVGAAHIEGLVHRDLSPQNIVLEPGALTPDRVRILDFGLSDLTGRDTVGTDVLLARDEQHAVAPGIVGNANYMSPEQARGLPVRAVSDLYQAGALLYFVLTGQAPFPRETSTQVMQAHLSAPPPVASAVNPGARPLDRIVTRAMTKTPARRYRNAAEFRAGLADVRAALESEDTVAGTAPIHSEEPEERTAATALLPPQRGSDLGYLAPTTQVDPVAEASEAPARTGATGAVIALAAIVAVVVAIGLGLGGTFAQEAQPEPPAVPTIAPTEPGPATSVPLAAPAPTDPAPEAPVAPALLAVPTLHGTLAEAEAALRAAGLTLGEITRVESPEPADRVLGQNPAPASALAPGAAVSLTVASGRNTVPQVTGMTIAGATAILESAGFVVSVARPTDPDAPAPTVSTSDPPAGAVLRVGVTIALRLNPAPLPEPTDTKKPDDAP